MRIQPIASLDKEIKAVTFHNLEDTTKVRTACQRILFLMYKFLSGVDYGHHPGLEKHQQV